MALIPAAHRVGMRLTGPWRLPLLGEPSVSLGPSRQGLSRSSKGAVAFHRAQDSLLWSGSLGVHGRAWQSDWSPEPLALRAGWSLPFGLSRTACRRFVWIAPESSAWNWAALPGRKAVSAQGIGLLISEAAALGDAQGVERSMPSGTPRADSTISKRAAIGSAARVFPSSLRRHRIASSLSRPRR